MAHIPFPHRAIWKNDADRKSGLAVGGDIENVFSSRILFRIRQRRALPYKVILVNVALAAGIGLHSTNGHGNTRCRPTRMSRVLCRELRRRHDELRPSVDRLDAVWTRGADAHQLSSA